MRLLHRDATLEDAPAIAALHAESWRATYRGAYSDEYLDGPVFQDRNDVWRGRLAEPSDAQLVVVAEAEGRIVGFACAFGHDDERWGTLLDNIHVAPALHRTGIGAALVARVGEWCRAHHADVGLYLWVLAQNERAQLFYRRLGASDRGGELREPSVGGGPARDVRRYAWDTLDAIGRPPGDSM